MAEYIALMHKDEGSDYSVWFPDFLGCITAGTTIEDARLMAIEALAFHVEGMLEDGEALPEASAMDEVMQERENRNAVAFLVTIAGKAPRAVRVNITLPEDVLTKIDHYAEHHGLTRSGLLARAARQLISA